MCFIIERFKKLDYFIGNIVDKQRSRRAENMDFVLFLEISQQKIGTILAIINCR